jgi:predicted nucleic-acid-binding protein
MLAIDTNVLVRYLTSDHPEQSSKAQRLLMNNDIFVSTTVMLECEWVLRRVYNFPSAHTIALLRAFAGLSNISVENPSLLAGALDKAEAGMDFADALHFGAASTCDALLTFDRKFIRAAAGGGLRVEEPI